MNPYSCGISILQLTSTRPALGRPARQPLLIPPVDSRVLSKQGTHGNILKQFQETPLGIFIHLAEQLAAFTQAQDGGEDKNRQTATLLLEGDSERDS